MARRGVATAARVGQIVYLFGNSFPTGRLKTLTFLVKKNPMALQIAASIATLIGFVSMFALGAAAVCWLDRRSGAPAYGYSAVLGRARPRAAALFSQKAETIDA